MFAEFSIFFWSACNTGLTGPHWPAIAFGREKADVQAALPRLGSVHKLARQGGFRCELHDLGPGGTFHSGSAVPNKHRSAMVLELGSEADFGSSARRVVFCQQK